MCESFSKIIIKYPYLKLIIAGEGEDKNKILSFRQFSEDAVAPANNAMATAGVAGLDKNVPVSKKAQKTWTAANAMFKRGKPNA